ncbi:hypothetical protein, partial [Avibacterium avium]
MHPLENEFITIRELITEYKKRFKQDIDLNALFSLELGKSLFIYLTYENEVLYFEKEKINPLPKKGLSEESYIDMGFFQASRKAKKQTKYLEGLDYLFENVKDDSVNGTKFSYKRLKLCGTINYQVSSKNDPKPVIKD